MNTKDEQRRAVDRLDRASLEVLRISHEIEREMGEIIEAVEGGLNARSLNHQRPFDLAAALTLRAERVEACVRLDVDQASIVAASQGKAL